MYFRRMVNGGEVSIPVESSPPWKLLTNRWPSKPVTSPSSGSGPAPGISHAKPPIQPLGSSPHTPNTTEISDELSFDEHFKRMNAADRKSGLL